MKSYAILSLGLIFLVISCAPIEPQQVQYTQTAFANQLSLATNACGPAALINSLRSGDASCQSAASRITGSDDQKKLRHIIKHHGAKSSRSIPGRTRWSTRGINASDLTDVANEVHPPANVTFHHPGSGKMPILKDSRKLLVASLEKGFPPIISVRRYTNGMPMESHFLTILAVESIDSENAKGYGFTYIDPAGAKKLQGTITTDAKQPRLLTASIPSSSFNKSPRVGSQILLDAMILRK
jgi:hypothetical protein